MTYYDHNGIPFLTKGFREQMKRGCNTGKCPPSVKSTPYPRKRKGNDSDEILSNRLKSVNK